MSCLTLSGSLRACRVPACTSVDGDEIEGQVKVKLGPLSLTYKGTAKFTDKDQANHTIAIEATGKETRGAGTASANVQATLKPGDAAGRRWCPSTPR